ncbi:reverse transcriptase family protein [Carnobacterium gallinarum]|uniref:reverse transcriptase family protein n=1 Tax=Carnobacterium gallinarum TaxID=2749 RepID=UPI001B809650|nr:reverse transcriptase family protein [Carnobacterium gallinarum]
MQQPIKREQPRPHIAQKQILKLDIEDFFGSVLFSMVCQSAFPSRYFPPAVSTLLTHLCCYQDALPQGASTSAAISNLVLQPFDDYIGKWCLEQQITYTRYCDDMTFLGEFDRKFVENKVRNFLQEMGFTLNQKKTKLITKAHQQSVTGIVVHEKPQVAKVYRKKL